MSGMKAALVTGASSGIGLALTRMLVEEGHHVTMVSRRPEKLADAAAALAAPRARIATVAGDVGDEDFIRHAVATHRDRFGRLDVLVNSAGLGLGQPIGELSTKRLDLQLQLNIRALALIYRESLDLLKAAGAEHRRAVVMNMASIAGKQGAAGFSVYSATKFAIVGMTQSMNRELGPLGIKSTALCPALVDTPMTDFLKDRIPASTMIQVSDITEAGRLLLRLSPACLIPELIFATPNGSLDFA